MNSRKTCSACQQTKELSEFHIQSKGADGVRKYRAKCKKCKPRAYKTKADPARALARDLGCRICVPGWLARPIIGEKHWDFRFYQSPWDSISNAEDFGKRRSGR